MEQFDSDQSSIHEYDKATPNQISTSDQSQLLQFEAQFEDAQESKLLHQPCPHYQKLNLDFTRKSSNFLLSRYESRHLMSQDNLKKKYRTPLIDCIDINWNINTNFVRDSLQGRVVSESQQNMQRGSDGCIFTLEIDDSGTYLATSNEQCQIFFWNLINQKFIKSVKEHNEIVTCLQFFHKTPNMFYSSSLDKTIRLWKNYTSIDVYNDHQDWIRTISLSQLDQYLISGCVSAQIFCWDPITGKAIMQISNTEENNGQSESYLNTINCLCFAKTNENIFLAGSRDGMAKIYDLRNNPTNSGSCIQFRAHTNKLNQIIFSKDDNFLLSSGRDNSIRLWDIRFLRQGDNFDRYDNEITTNSFIVEYKGHKCQGYNIGAHFYGQQDYILTGSEDSNIYIYDKISGKIERKIQTQSKVVHLVKPMPNSSQLEFVHTGLEEGSTVRFWGINQQKMLQIQSYMPSKKLSSQESQLSNSDSEKAQEDEEMRKIQRAFQRNVIPFGLPNEQGIVTMNSDDEDIDDGIEDEEVKENEEDDEDQSENIRNQIYLTLIEELMQEFGDLILKVFHKHNFTYCANMDWQTLLQKIEEQNDNESKQLLKVLNDQLIKRVFQVFNELKDDPQAVKEKYFSRFKKVDNDADKNKRQYVAVEHKCLYCQNDSLDKDYSKLPISSSQSNNQMTIMGFWNKIFGNCSQMYDQKEDLELERRKLLKEMLHNFPKSGNLESLDDTPDSIQDNSPLSEDKAKGTTSKEEFKQNEEEKTQELNIQNNSAQKYKLLKNITQDDIKRKRLIAFTTFQL